MLESLARTTETMKAMQLAEWMIHEQAACSARPERSKHFLSECGILYSRTELDAWLI